MVIVVGRCREHGSSQVASSVMCTYLTAIHSHAFPRLSFSNSGPTRRVGVGRATREGGGDVGVTLNYGTLSRVGFSVSLIFKLLRSSFLSRQRLPVLSFDVSLSLKSSVLLLDYSHHLEQY